MSDLPERSLRELRQNWGREIARERDFGAIARYHAAVAQGHAVVDERTWQDLGMDDLFAKLDRTSGMPGRQVLYDQLRTYENDEHVLAERVRQQALFQKEAPLRETIQIQSARLNLSGAEWLAPLLLNPLPAPSRFARWLYLLSAACFVCLFGIVVYPPLLLPAFVLIAVNLWVNATYGRRITPYFAGFVQINTMLAVSEKLARPPNSHQLPQLDEMRRANPMVAKLRKRLSWLVVDRKSLPELVGMVFEYLNMLFLFDVLIFLRASSMLRARQQTLVSLFQAIGSLDAAIAIASYRVGTPGLVVPTVVNERHLDVTGLYHPLIPGAVSNPLDLPGRSALIAGPNMAGKTAFIRTVGLNLILARTLALCHAEHAIFPRAVVRSSIRREDNLSEGQSYFFAEIEQIRDFIQLGEGGELCLFLIDEIYRGTNTIERIAASAAVLRHLARRQLVLATTHDAELQQLLHDTFDAYHFSDHVEDGSYKFDYRIHPGPATTRNAIKLLELSGYPSAIIAEAETLARRMLEPSSLAGENLGEHGA
jgi:hypothetical protein